MAAAILPTDMHSFQHIGTALRLFSGPDCLDQLGRELDRLNSQGR